MSPVAPAPRAPQVSSLGPSSTSASSPTLGEPGGTPEFGAELADALAALLGPGTIPGSHATRHRGQATGGSGDASDSADPGGPAPAESATDVSTAALALAAAPAAQLDAALLGAGPVAVAPSGSPSPAAVGSTSRPGAVGSPVAGSPVAAGPVPGPMSGPMSGPTSPALSSSATPLTGSPDPSKGPGASPGASPGTSRSMVSGPEAAGSPDAAQRRGPDTAPYVSEGRQPTAIDPAQSPAQNAAQSPTQGPASIAPSTAPATAPSTTSTAAVLRQVFPEVTRLSTTPGTHRVSLTLHPDALGEVHVTVVVRAGGVHVHLATDPGDGLARQALLQGAPELHRLLELAGAEARVSVREQGTSTQGQGSFNQSSPHQGSQGQPSGTGDDGTGSSGTGSSGTGPGQRGPSYAVREPQVSSTTVDRPIGGTTTAPAGAAAPRGADESAGRLDRLM